MIAILSGCTTIIQRTNPNELDPGEYCVILWGKPVVHAFLADRTVTITSGHPPHKPKGKKP